MYSLNVTKMTIYASAMLLVYHHLKELIEPEIDPSIGVIDASNSYHGNES